MSCRTGFPLVLTPGHVWAYVYFSVFLVVRPFSTFPTRKSLSTFGFYLITFVQRLSEGLIPRSLENLCLMWTTVWRERTSLLETTPFKHNRVTTRLCVLWIFSPFFSTRKSCHFCNLRIQLSVFLFFFLCHFESGYICTFVYKVLHFNSNISFFF